ncbi:MAG TPA: LysR family transcriptional regulator substrate-binding protein, partial [Thermoleophilia bacterium]|nr:LysR family transcriptional regulator substrate-binding protein [Thermoleophilia bacterium]
AGTVSAAVASVAGLRAGHVDLVGLPTLAVDPIAPLIGSFRLRHPEVTVRLAEPEDAHAVVQLVRDGQSEIGFAAEPFPDDLAVYDAFDQELLAVCPPGTKVGRRNRLPLMQLAAMPLVTTPPGTSTRHLVDDALAGVSIAPHIAVETGQREAIVPLVLAGAGTSVLPAPLAHAAAERGAVAMSIEPPLRRRIALIHRTGPLAPAARAFLTFALPRLSES